MNTEKELEKTIIHLLHVHGHYAVKVQAGKVRMLRFGGSVGWMQLAPAGTPDIFSCINGRFVAIEVKKDEKAMKAWERKYEKFEQTRILVPGAETSIEQHETHQVIERAGGIVVIVATLQEFENDLKELENLS